MQFIPLILGVFIIFNYGFIYGVVAYILSSIALKAWLNKQNLRNLDSIFQSSYIGRNTQQERQRAFFKTTFILMGKVAKSDDRISEEEIAHVEKFMQDLNMTEAHRQQAIKWFKRGSDPHYYVDSDITEFLRVCGSSLRMKRLLMVYLIGVSTADGVLSDKEEKVLRDIAARLGFTGDSFERLISMIKGQDHFSSSSGSYQSQRAVTRTELQSAYLALGVDENDNDADIKKTYLRLMKEHHPDKLIGQGVPKDMVDVATKRSQEIQAAYQVIKTHRAHKRR